MIKFYSDFCELIFDESKLILHMNKIILVGNVKNAAMGLFKIIEQYNTSIKTQFSDTLIAYHDSGKSHGRGPEYTLYYIGEKSEPDFFQELKKEYERIFKLKIFL